MSISGEETVKDNVQISGLKNTYCNGDHMKGNRFGRGMERK